MQPKDSSCVVDSMVDAVIRVHPKNNYFVAGGLLDWVSYHGVHYLPSFAWDWIVHRLVDVSCRVFPNKKE